MYELKIKPIDVNTIRHIIQEKYQQFQWKIYKKLNHLRRIKMKDLN